MVGLDPHRLAHRRLPACGLRPSQIAPLLPRHARARALINDDAVHGLAAAHSQRLIHHRFDRHGFATAHLLIGGDDGGDARVDDALVHALGAKAAKHHRVRGPYARARLHGHHALHAHRHIDQHAVAFFHAAPFQRVGQFAHLLQDVVVAVLARQAIVALRNHRHALAVPRFHMAV